MSPRESRSAARAVQPPSGAEVLPDAGDGAPAGGDGGGDVDPATGLSGADLEAFRQMESGEPPPAGDDDPGDDDPADPALEGDGDPADPPEPDAAAAPEPAAGQRQPPKTVNFSKHQRELKRERDRAAAAQTELETERTNRIKLSERIAIINEALAAQAAAAQQPAAQAPDPNAPPANPFEEEDIDPEVDYAASVKQIQRRQRFQNETQGRVESRIEESEADRTIRDTFTRDFTRMASTPEGKDLPAAYQFLKDQRLRQICLSEFDKDPLDQTAEFTPQEVKTMVDIFNAEEKWLVGNALKLKKSPAAAILKQAKIYGFTPPAPAPAPAPRAGAQVPARANGARPPAAAAAAAAPSAAQALADLAAATEAGKSLSDGGGAPPSAISAELLLGLDDDEFAEMVDGMSKHQLDALMGRVPS